MAQLNGYYNSEGDFVDVVPRPVDRTSPNGISRITPKESRSYAKLAYKAWVEALIGTSEETRFGSILSGAAGWTGGTYLTFTDGTTAGYIWFTYDGVGSDPAPGGTNFGAVHVLSTDSAAAIAEKLYKVMRFNLVNTQVEYMHGTIQVDAKNLIPGVRADATAGTLTGSVITVTVTEQGVDPVVTPWDGTYTDHEGPQDLNYFDEP